MRKKQAAKKPITREAGPPLRIANRAKTKLRNRLRPPRVLTYVDAVARYGSIRKAAEALNVASSALNRQVLDLEMDLGAPLFERLPRGVRVTSAGETFLVYARLVISELKAVESRIEQLRGLVRGQVSVAAAESVCWRTAAIRHHTVPGNPSLRSLPRSDRRPGRTGRGLGRRSG